MIRKYFLPILALLGTIFAVIVVRAGSKPLPAAPPVAQPSVAPFEHYIAGAGLVEASTENINPGTGEGGTVIEVFVKVGDRVKEGDPLFQIRNFTQTAEWHQSQGKSKEAVVAVKQAQTAITRATADLQRLKDYPRPEEIPPMQARVAEAKAAYEDAKAQFALYASIADKDKRAVSEEDLTRKKYAAATAQAKFEAAIADLALLKAGTWKPDLDVAQAKLDEAKSALEAAQSGVESAIAGEAAAKARLDRLLIKAPVTATVLQVKIHKGEYAPAAGSAGASNNLMVLGDIDTLVVRTDVDENDAWRFKPGAEAYAFVRGNRDQKVKLAFVRAEPYVVPKRSLTGESTERVDTRVLQVLYSFKSTDLAGVYVGQQMDVYIKAAPVGGEKPETTNPATTKTSK